MRQCMAKRSIKAKYRETRIVNYRQDNNDANVVLLHCGCLSLNPFIEFRIWNNSSSSDVLYIQASISISPKYESK